MYPDESVTYLPDRSPNFSIAPMVKFTAKTPTAIEAMNPTMYSNIQCVALTTRDQNK